ncbi:DEAD/DEAH box helicase [Treponema sp. OMZ 305]|uniref:DEAD/DEAH box helicase n=1 Tax=Treponema sp. OMZ 305 TaxID=1659192 RepID=UPI0020A4A871|nr:DEAD/DEAH box helicase [Treponema sp. OMZ 305]UTC57207.1 DEAD/DEAH box helicase [Treponema sp. OMZ 305]
MTDFLDLPLYKPFVETLAAGGIIHLTPIQEKVIPLALEGKSVFFESETGTGKTFAFLLPLLTRLMQEEKKSTAPRILILSPTVELASQIKEAAAQLQGVDTKCFKTLLCVGGSSLKRQIDGLKEKPAVIIGTPARISDLIGLKKLKLQEIKAVVIDEADRQLTRESRDALQTVLAALPQDVQALACSATFNRKNSALLNVFLRRSETATLPDHISIANTGVLQKSIEHWALLSERRGKADTLRALIHALNTATVDSPKKMLIFTAPAQEVENLAQKLQYKKIDAVPLYGKLNGSERKQIIARFRSGKTRILITSDLSARGLDIADIDYIVQMQLSKDADVFIHRAGRTGRAGRKGINIVIGDEYELRLLQGIEKKLGITVYPKILTGGKIEAATETM